MLISAAVLIANTVRMGLFARRKEIGIMKLVGATNWRIRSPFLIEGLVESLIGAIAAVFFLFGLKVAFINPLYDTIEFVPWVTNTDVVAIVPWLLVAGAVVACSRASSGCVASSTSEREAGTVSPKGDQAGRRPSSRTASAPRLRDPRALRDRHRAHRRRGEVPPGGHGSLTEAFARVRNGEIWIEGFHIPPYEQAMDKSGRTRSGPASSSCTARRSSA